MANHSDYAWPGVMVILFFIDCLTNMLPFPCVIVEVRARLVQSQDPMRGAVPACSRATACESARRTCHWIPSSCWHASCSSGREKSLQTLFSITPRKQRAFTVTVGTCRKQAFFITIDAQWLRPRSSDASATTLQALRGPKTESAERVAAGQVARIQRVQLVRWLQSRFAHPEVTMPSATESATIRRAMFQWL
jgi:hypothetical protein